MIPESMFQKQLTGQVVAKERIMTNEELLIERVEKLQQELAILRGADNLVALGKVRAAEVKKEKSTMPKNKRVGTPTAGRKYVLLATELSSWGKVPQQQKDVAEIILGNFKKDEEFTEAELYDALYNDFVVYPSLVGKQDPTYIFRYYRGLSPKDGKHAGFVARDFIRQIN